MSHRPPLTPGQYELIGADWPIDTVTAMDEQQVNEALVIVRANDPPSGSRTDRVGGTRDTGGRTVYDSPEEQRWLQLLLQRAQGRNQPARQSRGGPQASAAPPPFLASDSDSEDEDDANAPDDLQSWMIENIPRRPRGDLLGSLDDRMDSYLHSSMRPDPSSGGRSEGHAHQSSRSRATTTAAQPSTRNMPLLGPVTLSEDRTVGITFQPTIVGGNIDISSIGATSSSTATTADNALVRSKHVKRRRLDAAQAGSQTAAIPSRLSSITPALAPDALPEYMRFSNLPIKAIPTSFNQLDCAARLNLCPGGGSSESYLEPPPPPTPSLL